MKDLILRLLPKAIEWASQQEQRILKEGYALTEAQLEWARQVGVLQPELIRVMQLPRIPNPTDAELMAGMSALNFHVHRMGGLTLGYGIYLAATERLMRHESRHVYQYEQAGGIDKFLPIYMMQIADVGYQQAPYEVDARSKET